MSHVKVKGKEGGSLPLPGPGHSRYTKVQPSGAEAAASSDSESWSTFFMQLLFFPILLATELTLHSIAFFYSAPSSPLNLGGSMG